MSKYLKTWFMREQEQLLNQEKISYSKWLENIEQEVIKNWKKECDKTLTIRQDIEVLKPKQR
jgi:hypothetical protein